MNLNSDNKDKDKDKDKPSSYTVYNATFYDRNKERIRQRNREYYAKNRERLRAYFKQYLIEHPYKKYHIPYYKKIQINIKNITKNIKSESQNKCLHTMVSISLRF